MISLRDHLEALRKADRERAFLLFMISIAVALFDYYELTRRGHVNDAKAEKRNEWVDGQLRVLQDAARDGRTAKLTREAILKAGYAFAVLIATAVGAYAAYRALK